MSDRLFAAREANLEGHRHVVRPNAGQSGVDHELAVPPTDVERGDRAAAVALEKVHDQPLEAVSKLLDCWAGGSHARNGKPGEGTDHPGTPAERLRS